jgi:hypothetical protein
MKHPRILPGRGGLPATSNVPWSQEQETNLRGLVLINFIAFWVMVLMDSYFVVLYRHRGIRTIIYGLVMMAVSVGLTFGSLQDRRRKLYAMLLNKPRDTQALTQWTEHTFPGWEIEKWTFVCQCGRDVDMHTAQYFKATKRFSRVCECGRGHFMLWPVGSWVKR